MKRYEKFQKILQQIIGDGDWEYGDGTSMTENAEEVLALLQNQEDLQRRMVWFRDSPDAGLPECMCSLCGKRIGKDEIVIRLFDSEDGKETRIHKGCWVIILRGW